MERTVKRAVVLLTPGQQIRKDKTQQAHRKYPPGYDYVQSYVGLRGRNKPRCLARGCVKTLRVYQLAACSEFCQNAIINDALLRLKQCGVTKEQLLTLYE